MAEPPEPRREPRTAEGRAIVDAIAEATALLLDRDGYEALTTNAIARVAGVSIGSLYQYFGDKQAVVLEVARRLEGRALEVAMERAEGLGDTSAREATAQLVDVLLDPRLGGPASRRALLLQVPPAWLLPASGPTDRSTERLLRAVMEALPFREGPRDVMAFVVFHAVEGVIEDALLHRPVALFEGAFRRELFSLAWRYLAPAGADLSPHPVRTPDAWPPPSAALSARLADEPPAEEATPVHRVTPKSARGRASVEAILEAALERLAEAGWEGASARSIAKRAGVSAATLYRYFPHLRAIVAELARRRETRLL
ncbi:MAG TPA: TetR/AcrR family transcriptional regulator, partial [Polyangiaceae bacterium LLY-WYZ-15_(1-7)]|nr:TetR/AcrR family transcriptional regulator [Polyangiaceae bacterium LLY-WYZ-15_(1-7)]